MNVVPSIVRPWYDKRWFKTLVVIAGAVIAIIVVVATWMGLHWLASPEKALLDAADYALRTPGTYTVTSERTHGTLVVTDNGASWSGNFQGLEADAIIMDSMLYVKSPDPAKLYTFFAGTPSNGPLMSAVQSITTGLQNQWVSINIEKGGLGSQSMLALQCGAQEKDTLQHSADARNQWLDAYRNSSFLTIHQAGHDKSSATYNLRVDAKARTAFFDHLKQTSFYQSLSSCSGNSDIIRLENGQIPSLTTVISQPDHILRSLTVNPGAKDTITITTDYKAPRPVEAPANAIGTDQLIYRYFQSLTSVK